MSDKGYQFVYAANVKDIEAEGKCLSLSVKKQPIVLFLYNSKVYALDNRCPHMGFPLSQGTLKDCILTCHWHHARFDLHNGGTFDQWAGDVKSYPVQIRDNSEIWIGIPPSPIKNESYAGTAAAAGAASNTTANNGILLDIGLKRNISLIIAKAIIGLSLLSQQNFYKPSMEDNADTINDGLKYSFRKGLEFGTMYKQSGWGIGLTIHTCMMNIATLCLHKNDDKLHALYHGLSAVAQDCASMPPRFIVAPLPKPWPDLPTLKRWFRQFVESRNAAAAERCLVTAIHADADAVHLADMLFAAATDHRFIGGGHTLDFTNKALEALDLVGWNDKELVTSVLSSLVSEYADAERMEESSSWRYPVDLITILENAFIELPNILKEGSAKREKEKTDRIEHTGKKRDNSKNESRIIDTLLGDDPQLIVDVLLDALKRGMSGEEIAGLVAYAAALRIDQFNTRNEFSDWDVALHTFTFANAIHQSVKRISTSVSDVRDRPQPKPQSPATSIQLHELIRGIFDAAMRVYLNRFLNIPPASIPNPGTNSNTIYDIEKRNVIEKDLSTLLDKQQQVDAVAQLLADYYGYPSTGNSMNNSPELQLEQKRQGILMDLIGRLLLREDRSFHLIQMIEAALRQCSGTLSSSNHNYKIRQYHFILSALRYLAAHSPTMRSQTQTYQTAIQLSLGQNLFE
jgi:nitrite reductase/ring-hydroxylating ferredoxin subunit